MTHRWFRRGDQGPSADFLNDLNANYGTTFLLTTHDMQDIEAICSRVVVIDHGEIKHDGNIDSLKQAYGGRKRTHHYLLAPLCHK